MKQHTKVSALSCLVCRNRHDWHPELFVCPDCGGNLLVEFRPDALQASGGNWRDESQPGLWKYAPLLPLETTQGRTPLSVGGTPLLEFREKLPGGPGRLYFKDDSRNPSASFKDRAGAIALAYAVEMDAPRIAGASTGNAGSSMACLAASIGRRATVFVPKTAPKAKVAQLLLYGAAVIRVDGVYDDAFDLCTRICKEKGWFNRNTGANPYTREGKKTVSFELVDQLGIKQPDMVFVSVGDGNIFSGVWKGFRDLLDFGIIQRMPVLVAVQSELSNAIALAHRRLLDGVPFGEALQPVKATTIADSISVDLPRDGHGALRALEDCGGFCIQVSDQEILEAASFLASRTGIFAEPAGACATAGILKYARNNEFKGDETVVSLVTGSGLKDIDSLLKAAPPAIDVPRDYDGAMKILDKLL
jgi:threonine synthase